MREIRKIILHWEGLGSSRDMDSQEFVNQIRTTHINVNGWQDIGYHYLIGRSGKVYNGRDDAIVGAHCEGDNYDSIGICMLYGTKDTALTAESFNSLVRLVAELCASYNIPKECIYGHKHFLATACPGFINELIPEIRRKIQKGDFSVSNEHVISPPFSVKYKTKKGEVDLPCKLIANVGYVEIRALASALGLVRLYDANTKSVTISKE